MKRLLSIIICFLGFYHIYSQASDKSSYYQIGIYADYSAEFIYLHYARVGFQKYLSNSFSLQGALKIGSRSVTRWYIPTDKDAISTNWINWHMENPNGNPFFLSQSVSDTKEFGISSFPIQDHSMFYANLTFSGGFDIPLPFQTKLQMLGGVGFRYTDEHRIGESGDATFEYFDTEYIIYYLIPIYQRGIDGHLTLELNLIIPISEKLNFKVGALSDFTLGFMTIGVGNYYHAGGSLQIRL